MLISKLKDKRCGGWLSISIIDEKTFKNITRETSDVSIIDDYSTTALIEEEEEDVK